MASKKPIRLLICMLAVYMLSQPARPGDVSTSDAVQWERQGAINLSHDLVRLGIASSNLPPDSPTTDARPLFEAALSYARSHPVHFITVDRGAYYFLTPQDPQAYLRFSALSDLTVDLADSMVFFAGAFLQGFALVNCERVTLTRFRADFINPPYTHVQLTAVDPVRRTLAYTVLAQLGQSRHVQWVDCARGHDRSVDGLGNGLPQRRYRARNFPHGGDTTTYGRASCSGAEQYILDPGPYLIDAQSRGHDRRVCPWWICDDFGHRWRFGLSLECSDLRIKRAGNSVQ
jgi:hypothetical protein